MKFSELNWNALKSKTVWFGIAQVVVGGFMSLDGGVTVDNVLPIVTGVVTLILRALTTTSLADK